MADYQFPGANQWQEKPAIGTGEGESPLAPAPQNEITMRTMASDVASMKEMGGGEPQPYKPTASVGVSQQQTQPTATPITPQQPFQNQTFNPLQQAAQTPVIPLPPQKKGSALFGIIAGIIIILGLGAIGYFYVYPKFFGNNIVVEEVVEQQAPAQEEKVPETQIATTTESTSTIQVPPISGLSTHTSLFKTPADFASEATLQSETVEAIKETWKGSTVEVPVFREVVFRTAVGTILGSSKLANIFIPNVVNATTSPFFEEDFTLFTYTNQKGVWPGMILKAKKDSLEKAKEAVKTLESNTEWRSLFMVEPGKEQKWKDGKVSTMTARYIPFSTQGIAFSYTWFDDVVLISTNYQGAQDAAKKLGY